jgi:hypothetical protein
METRMAQVRWMPAILAGVALFAATSAGATGGKPPSASQASPAPEVSGVTVTPAPKPNPLIDPASQFVRLHLPESLSGQYPRFRDPICVRVVGLPPEFAAFVAKRVVHVALQVKAPVAKAADCLPNVNVIFTPRPQAQLDDIAKRRDILMGFHFPSQLKTLTSVNRPIQAWYVTRTRDTTGASWIEVDNNCPINVGDTVSGPCGDRPVGRAGSRLGNDMSAEVVHSLILADTNKVAGEKIDAVADYIAVLALAKWQELERCNTVPTILNLMADGCAEPPEAITSADLGLLIGLYSVDPREFGSQQRMSIADRMENPKAPTGKTAP